MRRPVTLLDAPSNLGLRPPVDGAVPGCYKAPGALRDTGLLARLDAVDAGVVTPPRYLAAWQPGDGVRNSAAISSYSRLLAERIDRLLSKGAFPLVLGGDCSILLGPALALRRQGRYGLAFLDGHDDFRHLGNAPHVGAAAGEDLALVTGRGAPELVDIDGMSPYVRDEDVVLLGSRQDESRNAAGAGIRTLTSHDIMTSGVEAAMDAAAEVVDRPELGGFWIHLDVDVLDPSIVSAVDSPDPGGIDVAALTALLRGLRGFRGAVGLDVTVFDPDLDHDGSQAALIADVLVAALSADHPGEAPEGGGER